MNLNVRLFFLLHLTLLILLSLTACGGGSSGTGIGNDPDTLRVAGLVVNESGEALEGATVTLVDTGESATTDEAGGFNLTSAPTDVATTLSVAVGEVSGSILVAPDNQSSGELDLSLMYDPATGAANLLSHTLRARIVRACSPQFLNARTVTQIGVVPSGFTCTLEVEIKSDGTPLDDVEFALEYRGCAKNDQWVRLGEGRTGSSGMGSGEISFEFQSDPVRCVYRALGPLNRSELEPLAAQLHTFEKRDFDGK